MAEITATEPTPSPIDPFRYFDQRAAVLSERPSQTIRRLVDTFKSQGRPELEIYSRESLHFHVKRTEQLRNLLQDSYQIKDPVLLSGMVGGIILLEARPGLDQAFYFLRPVENFVRAVDGTVLVSR